MCQPGVQADCDKEQHAERFLSLLFLFVVFFFFFLSSLLKKQVLAWIREKLHHLEEKKRNGKEGGRYEKKEVATRPKYICTYKAVLMKAKLI